MLSGPKQLASAEVAYSYFLHDYLKDPSHRSANRWHGKGAALLDLPRRVGKRVFTAILSGHVPGTDIRLGRVLAGEHQHRPGWDLTFSAPKSVSLEALLHGERRVMHAHDRAVRETLDWIEAEFLQTRGYDPETGKRPREAAGGMIGAAFRHVTSRNEDPQLHTHVVLANMTMSQGGAWRSVEPTLIMRNRRLIGAWYRNTLARILGEAGYRLVPTSIGGLPGFELAGYSQAHLDAFSTRRQDILRYMAEKGMDYSAVNTQRATLASRGSKIKTRIGILVEDWLEKARIFGLARDKAAVRRGKAARKLEQAPPRFSALEAAWQALEHLEERHAVFRPQELLATALGRDPGRHAHTELEAAIGQLEGDGHLVRTKAGDYTTRRSLRAEKEIVSLMREGRGKAGPVVARAPAAAQLAAASLTDGQREAASHILFSEDAVIGVQGFAGTGKTRMLSEIVRLAGAERVFGLAPSSAAARVLGMEAGIGATTLQYLLARYGAIAEGTATEAELEAARQHFAGKIMIVDESSMVGTVQMQALLRISRALGLGRLVLVGDTMQLKAVSAGQPFRLLQKAGMATARMDDILRQRSADLKGAVAHMVEGDPELAMASLGADVRELPPDALGNTAARLWLGLPSAARAKTAILAPTHALREEINAVIREGLADEGVLRGKPLEIMRLVDRRLTRPLTADANSYREGDVVIANRDVYGLGEGEAWTVTGAGEERVELARKGQEGGFRPTVHAAGRVSLYETRPISLMAGDEIVFTRNLKRRKIINGERARIEAVGRGRVRIRLASGRGLSFGVDDDDLGHIDHAWSSTVHRAQGMTKDNVIAVLDASSMMSDRAMLYVEMSRARDGFVLLTDDTEQLAHRLAAEGEAPHSALEETGEESWLTPGPGEGVADRGPLCPALHDWRVLAEDAGEAGLPVREMDGYGELIKRIRRRSQAVPEMPAELVRALADHDRRAAGQARIADWVRLTTSASQGRTRLLNAARAASSALQEVDGYARWREDAARAVDEGKEILDEDKRRRQHLDAAKQPEERMGELERALEFDREAAAIQDGIRKGEPPGELARRIRKLERAARPGEMPPGQLRFRRRHRQQAIAGTCRSRLETGLAARLQRLAGEGGAHGWPAELSDWHTGAGLALGRLEAVEPGAGKSELAGRVRDAMASDGQAAAVWAGWQALEEKAGQEGLNPVSMPGHSELMRRIGELGDGCPAVLAKVLAGHEAWQAAKSQCEDILAKLGTLEAEHQEMWSGWEGPVTEHPRYAGWLRQLDELLDQAPSLPAGEFRDAVEGGVEKARQQARLDGLSSRLALCLVELLHLAAARHDPAAITALIEAGADPDARDKDDQTPLHRAVMSNCDPATAACLIKFGADPDARDRNDWTPLHRSAGWNRNTETTACLTRLGAGLEVTSKDGMTPLHMAARWNDHRGAIARLLALGAELEARNIHGETPLHVAVPSGGPVAPTRIDDLLAGGANLFARDKDGMTPLEVARKELAKGFQWRKKVVAEKLEAAEAAAERDLAAAADPDPGDKDDEAALHEAARSGNPVRIAILIKAGTDPNARDKQGQTPLIAAARQGAERAVTALIDLGADPNARNKDAASALEVAVDAGNAKVVKTLLEARDQYGRTLLHLAVHRSDLAAVTELLERGASVHARDEWSNTPLHLAAMHATAKVATCLLARNADPNTKNREDRTPLDLANLHGGTAMVASLLAGGWLRMNARDKYDCTPLDYADLRDDAAMVDLLTNRRRSGGQLPPPGRTPARGDKADQPPVPGEAKRVPDRRDQHAATAQGETQPRRAAGNDKPDAAAGTVAGQDPAALPDPNARDEHGKTPLHRAAMNDDVGEISRLIELGADPAAKDRHRRTPLHLASQDASPEVITRLIKLGCDLEARDWDDRTPLHYAAGWPAWTRGRADPVGRNGNPGAITRLVRLGADLDARDRDGRTPLAAAWQADNDGVIAALAAASGRTPLHDAAIRGDTTRLDDIAEDADPEARDRDGRTPLYLATREGNTAIIPALVARGADPNAKDEKDDTLLRLAIRLGNDTAAYLLELGADPNAKDEKGETPLHVAVGHDNPAVITLLIAEGADPNARDARGRTPLHLAAALNADPEMITRLIEGTEIKKGADRNAKDEKGETPLHVAIRLGDDAVACRLAELGADLHVQNAAGETPLHLARREGNTAEKVTAVTVISKPTSGPAPPSAPSF